MTSWQSGDIIANGIQLHYTRTGGGHAPIVLAHGVTDDGLCWTPVAEALASEYDMVMVDARGHGRSAAPENGYDPVTLAQDLHGIIQALELGRPVVWGHSMGAATTLVMAGLYPEAPHVIVLEDPPAWWNDTGHRMPDALERAKEVRAWISRLKSKTREEIMAEGHTQNPRWSEAELAPWADAKLYVSLNVINHIFTPDNQASVDWPAILQRITCPALVVTADLAKGAILSQEGVAALQAQVPQLQVAHVPDAGHCIRRDQLSRYLEVVRAFLSNVAAPA